MNSPPPLVIFELGSVFFRCGEVGASLVHVGAPAVARAPPCFGAALFGGFLAPTLTGMSCAQSLCRVREEMALCFSSLLGRVLHVAPGAARVALVCPLALPDALRYALLRALLDDVGVRSVALLPSPLAAVVGAGAWTALVVDVGERCARVAPVVQGHVLAHCAREAAHGGAAALHAVACALVLAAADSAAAAAVAAPPPPLPAEGAPLPALAAGPLATLHPVAGALALGRSAQPYGGANAPWREGLRDWELPALAAAAGGAPAAALAARLRGRPLPVGGDDAVGAVALWVEHTLCVSSRGAAAAAAGDAVALLSVPPHVAGALALPAGAASVAVPAAPWAAAASGALLLCPRALADAAAAAAAGLAGAQARDGHLPAARAALRGALHGLAEGSEGAAGALPRAVAEALLDAPVDARRALARSVVVCGGPAAGVGFAPALLAAVRRAVAGETALAPLRALSGCEGGLCARVGAAGAAAGDAAFFGGAVLAAALDVPCGRGGASPLARASLTAAPAGGEAGGEGVQWRGGRGDGEGAGGGTAAASAAATTGAAALAAGAGRGAGPAAAAPPLAAPPATAAAARLAAMAKGLEQARKGGAGKK
jgi:hypothetical protein